MAFYEINWSKYGTALIEADSEVMFEKWLVKTELMMVMEDKEVF